MLSASTGARPRTPPITPSATPRSRGPNELGGVGVGGGGHRAGADGLEDPERHEGGGGRRDGAQHRGDAQHQHPGHEDAAAAVEVAGAPGEGEERRLGHQEPGDHPGDRGDVDAEVGRHRGQRDVDDADVDDREHHPARHDQQREPAPAGVPEQTGPERHHAAECGPVPHPPSVRPPWSTLGGWRRRARSCGDTPAWRGSGRGPSSRSPSCCWGCRSASRPPPRRASTAAGGPPRSGSPA